MSQPHETLSLQPVYNQRDVMAALEQAKLPKAHQKGVLDALDIVTTNLVTKDYLKSDLSDLKAEIYRALTLQTSIMIAAMGIIATLTAIFTNS